MITSIFTLNFSHYRSRVKMEIKKLRGDFNTVKNVFCNETYL